MIKAIIFDCFGVLAKSSLEPFVERYLSHDPELEMQAYELDKKGCIGLVSYKDIVCEFAAMAGISEREVTEVLDQNPPNVELFDYIRTELRPQYKLGFLSNASDNWLEEIFSDEQRELFDDFVLSCEVKLAKPDKKIFDLAAERLGVTPSGCIFIDDIERYCEGATKAGMKTILYQDFEQFKADLIIALKT